MSLSPHIEDGFRAARHDAERYWDGYDPAEDYAPGDEEPMTVQPDDCSCSRCLRCALERRTAVTLPLARHFDPDDNPEHDPDDNPDHDPDDPRCACDDCLDAQAQDDADERQAWAQDDRSW